MNGKLSLSLAGAALVASVTALLAEGVTSHHLVALDADGNGAVERTEFENFMEVTFTHLDANDDGVLTAEEASELVPADAFTTADANGNRIISGDEFAAAVTEDFRKADLDGDGRLN